MKKLITVLTFTTLTIVGMSSAIARDSPRMEPFNGDVEKATQREQLSIYYILAKMRYDANKAKALKATQAAEIANK